MSAPQPSPLPRGELFVEVAVPRPLRQRFSYRVPEALREQIAPGSVVRVPFGRSRLLGVVEELTDRCELEGIREVEEILPEPYRLDETARQLAHWIAGYYACSDGEALHLLLPPRPGTRARRHPIRPSDARPENGPDLSDEQREALDRIVPALDAGVFESFLLHGVTGSGKTEVYLRLIERAVQRGRRALVLLPEIALTPQTLRRLERRFPGRVAPYHSRLSHGERCVVWEAAARGELDVVVGARSAAFVPMRDLGLVVVDEEHEPSYKADDRPRYHGRDVALVRARLASVPIVLGSATPSLESWYNADSGKHTALALPARVGGADALPAVRIVDRRGEGPLAFEPLGEELCTALDSTLGRGEQAIVFHNRRGFARWLQCHTCGNVVECPHCDISLTYHLREHRLRCHYCDHQAPLPRNCPSCQAPVMDQRGTGTQRVEVALETRFPEARVLRLDQDSTRRKQSHGDILDRFGRGEADVLVGTQMVAKGLHFPRVTLVAVIDADAGLHFPDFRAHERAFQLLTQVSGRSGRVGPGEVVLQTLDPEHRVLSYVRDHDVVGFLRSELEQRRALGYPPHRRLAAITATAPAEDRLDRALDRLAASLEPGLRAAGIDLLGPARAALGRINRRYRGQILLKGALGSEGKKHILDLFDRLHAERPGGRQLELALDVDPLHLL